MFASQLLRLIGERKSWGLLCSMQGRAENSCNYCFLNQKDDLRLLWLWKLLIKLRRSSRRHFCIVESSFKGLDHNISETRIWGVLTSTPVTLSFTLSMKVARNAGSLLQTKNVFLLKHNRSGPMIWRRNMMREPECGNLIREHLETHKEHKRDNNRKSFSLSFFLPLPSAMFSHFLLHTKSISNHFLLPFPSFNNPFYPALYKCLQIWSCFTKIYHMRALIMMRMLMIDVPQGVRWWFCTGVDTTKPLLGVDRPRDCNRSGIGWNIARLVLRCRAVHFGGVLWVLSQ